jgi:hypothetical protein
MGSGPPHLDQKKPRRRTSAGLLFDCLSHDTQSLAGFICAVDTGGTLAGVGLCRSSSMSWNTEARALGGSPRSTWLARSACAAAWSKPHHRNGAVRLRHTIVTVLCDYGARYQSKLFDLDFLRSKDLPMSARSERSQPADRSRQRDEAACAWNSCWRGKFSSQQLRGSALRRSRRSTTLEPEPFHSVVQSLERTK